MARRPSYDCHRPPLRVVPLKTTTQQMPRLPRSFIVLSCVLLASAPLAGVGIYVLVQAWVVPKMLAAALGGGQ